jgi:hypothetical protein
MAKIRNADAAKLLLVKKEVLKIYAQNPKLEMSSIAYRAGTNTESAIKFIKELEVDMVSYFDFGLAPSTRLENTFFLFSDNGAEKSLIKKGNYVQSTEHITPLEALYIKINLGCDVKHTSALLN